MTVNVLPFMSLLGNIVDNRGKTCPVSVVGMPLIATNCVKNNVLYPVFEKVRYVSDATYKEWFRGHPEPGDLIFVTKGSPGNVCMAPDPVNFCIAQDMVAIRADENKIYPKYLFAVLRSPEVQANIENMHVGTLIPHFKKGDFDKLFLPVPDKKIQEYVGDCHFDLCAKIELNQRMNETLEAMARALFKSWFVDFDPVRAKAEGREPEGMDAATAALFPATFNDNGLPEGWGLGQLDDLLVLQRGFDLPNAKRIPGQYTVLAASGPNGTHNECMVSGPGVTTGRSGVLGNVFFIHEDFWPLNTSLWVKEFKVSTPAHAYYLLQGLDLGTFNAGSAVPTLNRNHVHSLPAAIPPKAVVEEFDRVVMPLLRMQRHNELEMENLSSLRDTLLPKLISGELRIDEAQEHIREAVG